jgi:hypothetical protein
MTRPKPRPRLLLLPEVSEVLRTPVETLRYWRHRGEGPPFFRLGARVVCIEDELYAWIEAQRAADRTAR